MDLDGTHLYVKGLQSEQTFIFFQAKYTHISSYHLTTTSSTHTIPVRHAITPHLWTWERLNGVS